jgi:hypothetical protein
MGVIIVNRLVEVIYASGSRLKTKNNPDQILIPFLPASKAETSSRKD